MRLVYIGPVFGLWVKTYQDYTVYNLIESKVFG